MRYLSLINMYVEKKIAQCTPAEVIKNADTFAFLGQVDRGIVVERAPRNAAIRRRRCRRGVAVPQLTLAFLLS